jgi:hypothetical protein
VTEAGRRVLTGDEVAAVLRRAAELDKGSDDPRFDIGMEVAVLEEAAAEVGLSPAAVRQAVAELDVGALDKPDLRNVISEQAVILRPLDRLAVDVDRMLRRQLLVIVRRQGNRTQWRARSDPGANLRRALNRRGSLRLNHVRELRVTLAALEEDQATLVRFEVDGPTGRGAALPVAATATTGAAGVGAALAIGSPTIAAAGAGIAVAAAGLIALEQRRQRVRAEMAGFGLAAVLAELSR